MTNFAKEIYPKQISPAIIGIIVQYFNNLYNIMHLSGNNTYRWNADWLVRLMIFTWAISKCLSYQLWMSDRLFPLSPAIDVFDNLPPFLHLSLFFVSMVTMLIMIIRPSVTLAWILVAIECLSCLSDQNRWQPWEYQFLWMLLIYGIYGNSSRTTMHWQIIIAGIYFFSGFYKLNSGYIHDTWQYLVLNQWLGINGAPEWLLRCGYITGLVEVASAIGLLFSISRKYAVWMLILMHAFILLFLGPFGLNLNNVIWPWNILMPFLLIGLFYAHGSIIAPIKKLSFSLSIVLMGWWVMPWFHLLGYWDKYFSFALYNGGTEYMYICPDTTMKKDLARFSYTGNGSIPCTTVISLYHWGMQEMNVVPYPEVRNYKAIAEKLDNKYPGENAYYLLKTGFDQQLRIMK